MEKTTYKDKTESDFDAFFDEERFRQRDFLAERSEFSPSKTAAPSEDAALFETILGWSKKIFLFLPGAFLLYMLAFTAVFFLPFHGLTFPMLFWLAASGFMVWAGLGDLKQTKHLLIPASIFLPAALIAFLASFLPDRWQVEFTFWYSIYLFPIFLVVPVLTKDWLDRE